MDDLKITIVHGMLDFAICVVIARDYSVQGARYGGKDYPCPQPNKGAAPAY